MNNPRGSQWRKWDLHIHSPLSICQDYGGESKFDEFIDSLEGLPSEVKVIGINDYYFIEGYKKVMEYKQAGRLQNIEKIFPVLEFRIDTFASASEQNFQKINLHVLFDVEESNLESEIAKINEEFIGNIHLSANQTTKKLTKENLINYSSDGKLQSGFHELTPDTKEVTELLLSDQWFNRTLTFLGYREWNNLDKGRQLKEQKKSLYNQAHAFFTASSTDDISQKEEVLYAEGSSFKPLIHSLDIHDFKRLNPANYQCFTWIKADPTFEGLKQIVYEPQDRISISYDRPSAPINYIDSLTLTVSNDAKIEVEGGGEDEFILAGFNKEILLNPYLNCIIGGRGVGKSTILSLLGLHSNNADEAWGFWEGGGVKPKNFEPDNILDVNGCDDFEYIGQGEINSIAGNIKELTDYIYSRIKQRGGKRFEDEEHALTRNLDVLDKEISLLVDKVQIEEKTKKLEKEKNTLEKVVKIDQDEEVSAKQQDLESVVRELGKVTRGKQAFFDLRKQLQDVLGEKEHLINSDSSDDNTEQNTPEQNTEEKSYYERTIKKILLSLKSELENIDDDELQKQAKEEERLRERVEALEKEYEKLLESRGISEEDIRERTEAPAKIKEIEKELKQKNQELEELKKKLSANYLETLKEKAETLRGVITSKIRDVENLLKGEQEQSASSAEIHVKYEFDKNQAWNDLAAEFYKHYEYVREGERSIQDNVRSLMINRLKKELSKKKINRKAIFDKLDDVNTDSASFLQKAFSEPEAVNIFQRIRDKHLYNIIHYRKLTITYNGEALSNRSFGERATTALIVFLLFGNKPIVIDEPEAHLDSRLIADYLVELIKRVKKGRQIIFATHNANFVINGDAEQIYALNVKSKRTEFTQMSIENTEHREELLNLEGGKDAFDKRGDKYSL